MQKAKKTIFFVCAWKLQQLPKQRLLPERTTEFRGSEGSSRRRILPSLSPARRRPSPPRNHLNSKGRIQSVYCGGRRRSPVKAKGVRGRAATLNRRPLRIKPGDRPQVQTTNTTTTPKNSPNVPPPPPHSQVQCAPPTSDTHRSSPEREGGKLNSAASVRKMFSLCVRVTRWTGH